MATAPIDAGPISVPVTLGATGLSLTGDSGFAGFAGRGGGGGGGGGGNGTGQGFKGKPLVPLSTARPQRPEWACKEKIRAEEGRVGKECASKCRSRRSPESLKKKKSN